MPEDLREKGDNIRQGELVMLLGASSGKGIFTDYLVIGEFDEFVFPEKSSVSLRKGYIRFPKKEHCGIGFQRGEEFNLGTFPTTAEQIYIGEEEVRKAMETDPRIKKYI